MRTSIEADALPLLATGMFATLYQIAEGIRAKVYGGDDSNPNNAMMVGWPQKPLCCQEITAKGVRDA